MTKTYDLPAEPFHLAAGAHLSPKGGACFNELAAMLAGKPFNDAPACVSPIIRRMGMSLNDRLDDERRQLLRPFVLRSLGTAEDGRDEERHQLCTEWLLHHALPELLEKADCKEMAQKLRDLPGDLGAAVAAVAAEAAGAAVPYGSLRYLASGIALFDSMLPPEPVKPPAIDLALARIICAAPEKAAA